MFKDNMGREWSIDVHVGSVKRVRDLAKIDLADFDSKSPGYVFAKLADPVALVDVLWVLCNDQAVRMGVNQDAFAAGMAGDALANAQQAVLECLADFSPGPRRNVLRALNKTGIEATAILEAKAMKALMDPKASQRLADLIEAIGSTSPTNLPASSGSIPTPSPSANST